MIKCGEVTDKEWYKLEGWVECELNGNGDMIVTQSPLIDKSSFSHRRIYSDEVPMANKRGFIVLKSKYIDVGAEIGAFDLHNSTSAKNSFYAMGTITIKKINA